MYTKMYTDNSKAGCRTTHVKPSTEPAWRFASSTRVIEASRRRYR